MTGVELDTQLMDMMEQASARRYYNAANWFESGFTTPPVQPEPVFVTDEEREIFNKISSKSNEVIKTMILELIEQLDSDEDQSQFRELWKKTKNKKKDELIVFYEKVMEEVKDQLPLSNLQEWKLTQMFN